MVWAHYWARAKDKAIMIKILINAWKPNTHTRNNTSKRSNFWLLVVSTTTRSSVMSEVRKMDWFVFVLEGRVMRVEVWEQRDERLVNEPKPSRLSSVQQPLPVIAVRRNGDRTLLNLPSCCCGKEVSSVFCLTLHASALESVKNLVSQGLPAKHWTAVVQKCLIMGNPHRRYSDNVQIPRTKTKTKDTPTPWVVCQIQDSSEKNKIKAYYKTQKQKTSFIKQKKRKTFRASCVHWRMVHKNSTSLFGDELSLLLLLLLLLLENVYSSATRG